MQDIMKPENNLTGVMVGRMAMNTTWSLSKIDNTFYGEQPKTLNREQMMIEYAEFAQNLQNKEMERGGKISNTILCRCLTNLFNGEYKGAEFRKHINKLATKPEY